MNLKILTSVFSLERKEVGLLDRGTSGNLNSKMITIVFFLRFTKPEKRVSLDHQYQKRTLSHLEPRQLSSMYTVTLKLFKWILIMEKILQWNKYCQVIYYIMTLSLTWLEYCSLFGGRIQLSEVYCLVCMIAWQIFILTQKQSLFLDGLIQAWRWRSSDACLNEISRGILSCFWPRKNSP